MGRPRYQHGYLRREGGGWACRWRVYIDGKSRLLRRSIPESEARTKSEARTILDRWIRETTGQTPALDSRLTLGRYYEEVWQPQKWTILEKNTRTSYASAWRTYIAPSWAGSPMGSITLAEIEAWLTLLHRQGAKYPTLHLVRSILHNILQDAKRHGAIAKNPADDVRLPIRATQVKENRALTMEEVRRIEATHGILGIVWQLMFWGALRPCELIALRWNDLADDCLIVDESAERSTTATKCTKNRKVRAVPIPLDLIDKLKKLREYRGEMFTAETDFIFGTRDGHHLTHQQARDQWLMPMRESIPDVTFQMVRRHTPR